VQVDPVKNLLYVKGQIPGHRGNFVKVRDAVLKRASGEQPERPFPTFTGELPREPVVAPYPGKDPFDYRE
jgi:large subunit ribosomal protein L3